MILIQFHACVIKMLFEIEINVFYGLICIGGLLQVKTTTIRDPTEYNRSCFFIFLITCYSVIYSFKGIYSLPLLVNSYTKISVLQKEF